MVLPSPILFAVIPILPVLPTLAALVAAAVTAILPLLLCLWRPRTLKRTGAFLWRQKYSLLVLLSPLVAGYLGWTYWRNARQVGGVTASLEAAVPWPMSRGTLHRLGRVPGSLDPTSPSTRWKFRPLGTSFFSAPTVVGTQVYIVGSQGDRGFLHCVDAISGKRLWSHRPDGYRATFSSPVFAQGKLFVGEGLHHVRTGRLICIDLTRQPGQTLWTFATSSHIECTPVVVDDRVFFNAGDDGVYCLQIPESAAQPPRVVWHAPGVDYPDVETSLAVHQGRVYVGLGIAGHALVALDAATGRELSRIELPHPVFSPPAIDRGRLYVGMGVGDYITAAESPSGQVCCVDLDAMRCCWTFPLQGTVLGAVSALPDCVVFGASNGTVYRLSLQGELLEQRQLDAAIVASLAVGERHVYAVTDRGTLHCLTLPGLQDAWQARIADDGHCVADPVLALDSIFVASESGGLLRIGRAVQGQRAAGGTGPGGRVGQAVSLPSGSWGNTARYMGLAPGWSDDVLRKSNPRRYRAGDPP